MSAPSSRARQRTILADRYLETWLGDPKTVLLLVAQAPLIGALVAGVWANIDADSPALYFVLALSAFFLGAVNASREIVKERAIWARERLFGLDATAYVQSKLQVLAMLAIVQATTLVVVVAAQVPLQAAAWMVGAGLLAVGLVGTTVGLAISAAAPSPDRAVMSVPLVVIPQILLSEFVVGPDALHNWTGSLQAVMPVHWAYRGLVELRGDADGLVLAQAAGVQLGWAVASLAAAVWLAGRAPRPCA